LMNTAARESIPERLWFVRQRDTIGSRRPLRMWEAFVLRSAVDFAKTRRRHMPSSPTVIACGCAAGEWASVPYPFPTLQHPVVIQPMTISYLPNRES
jgi:hypothetical protein